MDSRDKRLGMDRAISRRDFLGGVSVAIGASLLPACARNGEPAAEAPSDVSDTLARLEELRNRLKAG